MSFETALIASTATQAVGSIMQGEAQASSAKFNARVAQQNAVIARQQGVAAEQAQQRDAARQIGAMVAAYGASGVQSDVGSPLDVLADSVRMAELDRLTIQYNTELRARGFETQAQLDRAQASSARTSALFNAASSGARGYSMYQSNTPSSGGGSSYTGTGFRVPTFGGSDWYNR